MKRSFAIVAAILIVTVALSATLYAQHAGAGTPLITVPPHFDAVPVEKHEGLQEVPGADLEGHPLTSVVVTQCNLIVAVYMTMSDGQLRRFAASNGLKADDLMTLAYTATRSERVEVPCAEGQAAQYERRDPI